MELYTIPAGTEKKLTKIASHEQYDLVSIQLAAGEGIPAHDAPHTVLIIVQSGKVLFMVEGREQELISSTILHMDPKEQHSLQAIEDCNLLLLKIK